MPAKAGNALHSLPSQRHKFFPCYHLGIRPGPFVSGMGGISMPHSWLLSLLLVLTISSVPTRSQKTGAADSPERSRLVDYLKWTRQLLDDETKGLTAAQWNYKPAAERWSVAECVEHLARAEETILGVVDRALKAPPVPAADPETVREHDRMILRLATDRSQKFTAPEKLRPSGLSPLESLQKFHEQRAFTLEFARTTTKDMRAYAADHPLFKNADVYQWVLLAASHVERHVNQIREVKASPGFPK